MSERSPLPLPGRARAVAYEMLRVIGILGANNMVAPFIDSYAARFNRLGLQTRIRYRELMTTIGRESLLAMMTKTNRDLRRLLSRSKSGLLLGSAAEAAETFKQALFESLAETLEWSPTDRDEFRRDLDVYTQMPGQRRPVSPADARRSSRNQSPFSDRCAFLLDPSMMAEAREAAAKFLMELESRTDEILNAAFRSESRR